VAWDTLPMMSPWSPRPKLARPKLEGNIVVDGDRQLGFAEFGDPQGRPVFWLHGTPGARRQIPTEARVYAEQHHVRLIGVDRPGIGSSTPHPYANVAEFAGDLRVVADTLGIDQMTVVGLSGGGPYTLACAALMPDRVIAAGVLGGVAPTEGPDAIGGGVVALSSLVARSWKSSDTPCSSRPPD
jgi:pimeloyl-ACP methyl ester carboxylesterase